MTHLQTNGQVNTDKDNTMAKSVKVVAGTSDAARAQANAKEARRVEGAKSGRTAHESGKPAQIKTTTAKLRGEAPAPVKIRTNPGISGKGGMMVGGLYKPMGGGGLPQYNK
jgi:hypothetical protein